MLELTNCLECGGTAEIVDQFVLWGTDGPVEHVKTSCIGKEGRAGEARHILTFDVARLAVISQTRPNYGDPLGS